MSDSQTNSRLLGIEIELRRIRAAIQAYVEAQGIKIPAPNKPKAPKHR